jgi:hypothetical protein
MKKEEAELKRKLEAQVQAEKELKSMGPVFPDMPKMETLKA